MSNTNKPRRNMDSLLILLFIAVWIVLQVWILPRLGVQT
jgi:hypothetical protein